MPFTLHKAGTSRGDYAYGWSCDICDVGSSDKKGSLSGRFVCAPCTSDLCVSCANGRR